MLFDDNNNKSDYQKTIEEIDEYILFDQLTNNDKKRNNDHNSHSRSELGTILFDIFAIIVIVWCIIEPLIKR